MRHAILLLDIDMTLINTPASSPVFNQVTQTYECIIHWTGNTVVWREKLLDLKINCLREGIMLHVGIATYKPEYKDEEHKKNNLKGDYLSAAILEDEAYLTNPTFKFIKGLGHGLGLKNIIDPRLVYFTNGESKVMHAMTPAIDYIEKAYSVKMDPMDGILMDDQVPTCQNMISKGHNAICVLDIAQLKPAAQKKRITDLFENLRVLLNIAHPAAHHSPESSRTPSPPHLSDIAHLTFFAAAASAGAVSQKDDVEEEKIILIRDPITHKLQAYKDEEPVTAIAPFR